MYFRTWQWDGDNLFFLWNRRDCSARLTRSEPHVPGYANVFWINTSCYTLKSLNWGALQLNHNCSLNTKWEWHLIWNVCKGSNLDRNADVATSGTGIKFFLFVCFSTSQVSCCQSHSVTRLWLLPNTLLLLTPVIAPDYVLDICSFMSQISQTTLNWWKFNHHIHFSKSGWLGQGKSKLNILIINPLETNNDMKLYVPTYAAVLTPLLLPTFLRKSVIIIYCSCYSGLLFFRRDNNLF